MGGLERYQTTAFPGADNNAGLGQVPLFISL